MSINENEMNEETAEVTAQFILENEDDILKGLLECAAGKNSEDAYSTVEIRSGSENGGNYRRIVKYDDEMVPLKKGERVLIRIRVRGLDQEEYSKCQENATKYVRNPKLGNIKMAEETNSVRLYDEVIYKATHPDDRAKNWDNRTAWAKLNAVSGIDMVSKIMLAGEKNAFMDIIEKKSGFIAEFEEVAKK